jgi:hypothetical protein
VRIARCGATGELCAGQQLVARYEDMVAWISVLEAGYGFHTLRVQVCPSTGPSSRCC